MRRFLSMILSSIPIIALSAEIEGTVLDAESSTPLSFANVQLKDSGRGAISNREGKFRLELRTGAASVLVVSYLGYKTLQITVPPDCRELEIALKRSVLAEDPIIVTATRLQARIDPLPLKNLDQETIAKRYWAQDPPMLLAETPGIYAYNEAGNGIGNSYLTLRGFGQNRVAVMINGVPLNGGDSHEVWWVDLPDFAASLKDIQVQRGVMSGLYGGTALGGSINLLTDSFAREKQMNISYGMGSWGTNRGRLEYSSGLLDDALSVNLRLSSIRSDGYRDQSWTRSWAYYTNLSHFGERTTTRFNFYGGPENTHLAYKGITLAQLSNDRRANPLDWDNEEDHFHQPHFELHNRWQINPERSLSNTLFFTKGDGYYDQFREGRDAFEYNLVDSPADSITFDTDLIRRRTVDEWDGGWIPRFEQDFGAQKFSLGGELRLHDSHHFGDVQWALVYPANLPLYHRFYDYRVRKRAATAYVRDRIDLTEGLALQATLQLQHQSLELYEDKRFGVNYQRDFSFLSPRLGLSWQASARQSYFASAALGSRAPAHRDIYNAGDFWSGPGGEKYQEYWGNDGYVSHFEVSGDGLDYIGPEAKPEKVLDLELGGRINSERFAFDWTLYWMDFRDEIVPYAGALDDNQYPSNGNAEQSRHAGVELGGKLRLAEGWTLTGAAAFTRDRFIKYTEYGWAGSDPFEAIYNGQTIPGYPVYSWNLRLDGRAGPVSPWLAAQGAGRQWLDGRNLESRSVEPFTLLNAGLSVALPGNFGVKNLSLDLRVNNLLDSEYESSGYIEYDDLEPRWFVGAPRNVYAGLGLDL